MNPVALYFAGSWEGAGGKKDVNLLEAGVRKKLVSYGYPEQFEGWLKALDEYDPSLHTELMVDSGAFSAWNNGKVIDFDKYVKYCLELQERVKKYSIGLRIVNLDVIPGQSGQTKVLVSSSGRNDMVNKAAKQGYLNLKRMLAAGIRPIHVFHQGEHFRWLDRMVALTDYIGISPANDMPNASRRIWMEHVFEYMYKHGYESVKTHGFAVWSLRVLKTLPFTSCDSATWRIAAGLGVIHYPRGGFKNPDYSKRALVLRVSEKESKISSRFGKGVLRLLQEDGYDLESLQDWRTRTRINVRYFLGLEEWVNQYRASVSFPVTKVSLF